MQVQLSTATRVRSGATLSSTRERLSASSRLSCGLHCAVAGGGVRAELANAHCGAVQNGCDPRPCQTDLLFDTEWSSGSGGERRRHVEAIEPAECAVDPSEVTQGLSELKQRLRKTKEIQAQELVKQQLRTAKDCWYEAAAAQSGGSR